MDAFRINRNCVGVIHKEYKRITEKNGNNAFKRGEIEPE
jgi:hypothetical protein